MLSKQDILDRILVQEHFAKEHLPLDMSEAQVGDYKQRIKALLKEKDACLVAHYYTDAVLQQLADETGGCVSDSLEMARFGNAHSASTLVVAGV